VETPRLRSGPGRFRAAADGGLSGGGEDRYCESINWTPTWAREISFPVASESVPDGKPPK
jgi:hypothetical protein